ncbi:leucyl/phenylalanyl-tRNA--protein transferase [Entomospira culicis]|uniref:Leucyl/phenylalanyl-tRNA--protein transferase n=1 Tax=Entomospira culicis TaxID=2719989 RepID=A0A968GG76_9SPIO|nr:leucyl/phenylalanyl-tRNA--protein transferase [Entomospira culicis]NIZ19617.1 leucyl/phenylalanyl-tRNA--protein transferase [Entomospira culicis]NIZ69478.1 leucyl/phenylalanyl-tRNA--protein transferase [Entomospira culicis]WDI36593.1 leucyl/phenylalanyl-tRNA--protein transferase [Entomospira culicis]WDI38221.1 leucyl/phenylalanyl-tRNA--protein transferase [Entomospira culicis]
MTWQHFAEAFSADLDKHYQFPPQLHPLVVAKGGGFSAGILLSAYEQGIFPWGRDEAGDLLWCSPDPRCVLYPDSLYISKSNQRVLKNHPYTIAFDRDFSALMKLCRDTPRGDASEAGSWIDDSFLHAYRQLHHLGYAHCVTLYLDETLVGGLYGLFLGSVFFGESMVSLAPNVSKIALFTLITFLQTEYQLSLLDAQQASPHLLSWGATLLPQEQFISHLKEHATRKHAQAHWDKYRNE